MEKIICTEDGSIGFRSSYYRSHNTYCKTNKYLPHITLLLSKGDHSEFAWKHELMQEKIVTYRSDEEMFAAAKDLAKQLKNCTKQ